MRASELMLLGGPNSGKTHYTGQLYGRLRRRPGRLCIRSEAGTPADLSALEEVLRCLEEGRAAPHTAATTWAEVSLPLADDQGNALNLRWPDYGGEQLREIFSKRAVSETWRARLNAAEGWVLLLRPYVETTYPDALKDLHNRPEGGHSRARGADGWDANARWVELLQLLLHVAEVDTVRRVKRPRLAVLLSCYDELNKGHVPPHEVLRSALPLVNSFLDSIWAPEAISVWGLSALGRPLEQRSSDEAFIDDGPEMQGWVIPPEGGLENPDLSLPLAWLMGGG